MDHHPRRVVVTGIGAISPLGHTMAETWDGIVAGRSGAGPITLFDTSDFKVSFAAEVKGYEPTDHFEAKEARRLDRCSQFALVAAAEAMRDAGLELDPDSEEAERAGAVIGVGFGGMETFIEEVRILHERGPGRVSPLGIPKVIANMPAGLVSIEHHLLGPVSCTVTACSASANAIGDAAELIRRGAADIMLAGGSEAAITTYGVAGFAQARALSTRNDDPAAASRPFDAGRDGFVMGEGAAVLVLEDRERAIARGATIHAEVTGYGMSADSYHITLPKPGGTGAARAVKAALADARLEPSALDYVNAHGTSTPANDSTETLALKVALGEETARRVPVSSTKSMTGHLLGGAGAVEAAISIRAIQTGIVPPTINYEDPDPECDLDYVPNEARDVGDIEHVASNSFGFGGHNVTLIFSRA
ncbi:MAG TPA: beta-ketoacyl-ACP synthase II [Acidimicrobiia bacterium]|nr:beta-ketoacyl-ACP synthase II [Acidimicrobiia bacterium]